MKKVWVLLTATFSFFLNSPATLAQQDAILQEYGNTIVSLRPGVDDTGGLTLKQFVNCLKYEPMPADPTGKERKVFTSGNGGNLVVTFQNRGGEVDFHMSIAYPQALISSVSGQDPVDGSSEADDFASIATMLQTFVQACNY